MQLLMQGLPGQGNGTEASGGRDQAFEGRIGGRVRGGGLRSAGTVGVQLIRLAKLELKGATRTGHRTMQGTYGTNPKAFG